MVHGLGFGVQGLGITFRIYLAKMRGKALSLGGFRFRI